jgi:hypothetical protein
MHRWQPRASGLFTLDPTLITVWDAVAVDTIPLSAEYFLGYDCTFALLKARFPNAKKIWKVTTSSDPLYELDYDICDCERGDATFQSAAQWAWNKIHAKLGRPCIYVEVANKPYVTAALAALGLEWGRDVDCWLAWWDGVAQVLNGIFDGVGTGDGNIGHQYFNLSEFTYDTSVVYRTWVYPPPPTHTEADMIDAITIIPELPLYPKGGTFLNNGNVWAGPLDEDSVTELKSDPRIIIFESKTNSIFHAKPVVVYPAPPI